MQNVNLSFNFVNSLKRNLTLEEINKKIEWIEKEIVIRRNKILFNKKQYNLSDNDVEKIENRNNENNNHGCPEAI